MTHLAHLVRTDLRRFRVLLAIWLLVAVCEAIFRGVRPLLAADPSPDMAVELLGTVFVVTRWLGMIVIAALVVQTHPLVGSDAFWMTRPIPWLSLLASKLVLLWTTFVAVPAACEMVLTVAYQVPAREIVPVVLQLVIFQTLWLGLIVAISSVTRNLARLALVAGSLLLGVILLLNIAIAMMMRQVAEGPKMIELSARAAGGTIGFVVFLVLTIAAVSAQIALQYRTRSVRTSVAAGALGVAGAFVVAIYGPATVRPLPLPDWAAREAAVQLIAETPRGEFRSYSEGAPWTQSGGWQIGAARATLRGMEAGWRGSARLTDATIRFDDGTNVSTAGNAHSAVVPSAPAQGDGESGVVRDVLGVNRLLTMTSAPTTGATLPAIILTQAEYQRHLAAKGRYRGRFLVDLDRIAVAAALPLQAGAMYRGDRHRVVIDRIVPQAQAALVRIRRVTSVSIFDSEPPPEMTLYLRNRSRSEAVDGSAHGLIGAAGASLLPMLVGVSGFAAGPGSGFSVTTEFIRFPSYRWYGQPDPAIEIDTEWLSQAELVVVHTIPAGSVPRTLEIEGFEVAPAPSPRPPG